MGRNFNGKKRDCYAHFHVSKQTERNCNNCSEYLTKTDSCRIMTMFDASGKPEPKPTKEERTKVELALFG